MEAIMKGHIEGIKFGGLQIHGHVAVIPMISTNGAEPDYLTMKEAMEAHLLMVTEVTEGGQVPELKVINRADKPVLLPGWRRTVRRQAEPGAQYHHSAEGIIGNGHPCKLHRTWPVVLQFFAL